MLPYPGQVLIMPPFQGLGLGKKMLQIAYKAAADKKCFDLTVIGGAVQPGSFSPYLNNRSMNRSLDPLA